MENIIKKDIDKLDDYNCSDKPWGEVDITEDYITGKVLQMIVPNSPLNPSQIQGINNAIDYRTSLDISVIITIGK